MIRYLISCGAVLLATSPALANTMSADQISREIIGKTVCMQAQSGQICVRHDKNNVTNVVSGMPAQKGKWRFNGNEHCVTWTGAKERCSTFSKSGKSYSNSATGKITLR